MECQENRKSFVFYRSFYEQATLLEEMEAGSFERLVRIIFEYALNGTEPDLTGQPLLKLAFTAIRPQIDANNDKRFRGQGAPKGNRNAVKKEVTSEEIDALLTQIDGGEK